MNQINPQTRINSLDLTLSSPIYNASGPHCTTKEELDILANCPFTGAFTSKSCTKNYRQGNPLPRYYHDEKEKVPLYSINSTGLANQGMEFYRDYHPPSSECTKPYFVSVAGLSLQENLEILHYFDNDKMAVERITAIELNLSCPNIPGKSQTGYDFYASDELLRQVFELGIDIPIGLKMPPYFDLAHYYEMADVLKKYPISFLTCINSLGNGLVVDWETETPVIKPKGGFGGIGGISVKPFALANVHQWYKLLPNVPIIGCGGVRSGQDVFEHLLVGASAVQIGTQIMVEGMTCFGRIYRELLEIMKKKCYLSINEFQGNLKKIDY